MGDLVKGFDSWPVIVMGEKARNNIVNRLIIHAVLWTSE